jgi:LacI family transcriptional regulator
MLIAHLKDLGHIRLAFVDGGWIGDIRARRETFLKLGDEAQAKYAWMMAESNNPCGGYQAMKQLLALVPRPTAVLASDDSTAIGVLKAIYDEGLRVPEDISVTGFDDIDIARYTTPALTTIRQPIDEMARQSLQLLIDQIGGTPTPEEKLFNELDPEMVIRESTGPVPENG